MNDNGKKSTSEFYSPVIKPSLYASFDTESDGTNPLQHSMLALGIALFSEDNVMVDTFYCHILPQKNDNGISFKSDEGIMQNFWSKHPTVWKAMNENQLTPTAAMNSLHEWLYKYRGYELKWVAQPANCDWMWLKCYYEKYGPPNKVNIGFFCHCLSSLLRSYCLCHGIADKKLFMLSLSGENPYTHCAIDDAIAQGVCYMNLRKLLNSKRRF